MDESGSSSDWDVTEDWDDDNSAQDDESLSLEDWPPFCATARQAAKQPILVKPRASSTVSTTTLSSSERSFAYFMYQQSKESRRGGPIGGYLEDDDSLFTVSQPTKFSTESRYQTFCVRPKIQIIPVPKEEHVTTVGHQSCPTFGFDSDDFFADFSTSTAVDKAGRREAIVPSPPSPKKEPPIQQRRSIAPPSLADDSSISTPPNQRQKPNETCSKNNRPRISPRSPQSVFAVNNFKEQPEKNWWDNVPPAFSAVAENINAVRLNRPSSKSRLPKQWNRKLVVSSPHTSPATVPRVDNLPSPRAKTRKSACQDIPALEALKRAKQSDARWLQSEESNYQLPPAFRAKRKTRTRGVQSLLLDKCPLFAPSFSVPRFDNRQEDLDNPTARLTWTREPKDNFSDWIIVVTTATARSNYFVHKNILGAGHRGSKYFNKVFKTSTRSKSRIGLLDSAARAFPDMLDFIYSFQSESVKISTDTAVALRYLSDFFGVPTLFNDANAFIQEDMNKNNIHRYLREAQAFKDEELVLATMAIVVRAWEGVINQSMPREEFSPYIDLLPPQQQLHLFQLAQQDTNMISL
jgi:hypothetical protein